MYPDRNPVDDPLYLLAVLCLIVVVSEALVRRTWLRHLGTALLVIALTALAANAGLIPAGSTPQRPVPLYDGIFQYVAPLAIFWLLLPIHLTSLRQAGRAMIFTFLVGSAGTVLGVLAGMWLLDGPEVIGPYYRALGGMFAATYTGGGINFNAVALHYQVTHEGTLYAGAVAADNVMTALWMMATLTLPRVLAPWWRTGPERHTGAAPLEVLMQAEHDTEAIHPLDVGLLCALGLGSLWLSGTGTRWLHAQGMAVPGIVVLSLLALVMAQVPVVNRLKGVRVAGMFAIYLFLAVVGAHCDAGSLYALGSTGLTMLLLIGIIVGVHALLTFGTAWLLRIDLDLAAIASQANIGGSPSALALARSLGRDDLVLPGVMAGSLGYAIGTFIGLGVAEWLL